MPVTEREATHKVDAEVCDLWKIALDSTNATAMQYALLNAAERTRAMRFLQPQHRERFVAARSALRAILGRYLDTDPAQLTFGTGKFGKLYLPNATLEFNLSHSGNLAVLAVCTAAPVGIDIEKRRTVTDPAALAARYFSATEHAAILNASTLNQQQLFLTGWTRKEAVLKSLGVGLRVDAQKIPCGIHEASEIIQLDWEGSSLELNVHSLNLAPDHFAACATAPSINTFRYWDFNNPASEVLP